MTEMAHLLETHPDTEYDGDFYAEDLYLSVEETEERIISVRNLLSTTAVFTGLEDEVSSMLTESETVYYDTTDHDIEFQKAVDLVD